MRLAELLVQLLDHLLREGLGAACLGQAGFDGEQDAGDVEEIIGELLEAMGKLLDSAQILEHADRDGIPKDGSFAAEVEQSFRPLLGSHS